MADVTEPAVKYPDGRPAPPVSPMDYPSVYLAGPMTGIEDFNRAAFRAAAARLRALRFVVIDPSKNFGGDTSLPRRAYLRRSVIQVLSVRAVAVLPGWEASRGATLEVALARELGLPVFDAGTLLPVGAGP